MWESEGNAWRVKNGVFDEERNSTTRVRLRSVITEEGVTRERYEGVRDVLKEESFCKADNVWFASGNLHRKMSGLSKDPGCLRSTLLIKREGRRFWVQQRRG